MASELRRPRVLRKIEQTLHERVFATDASSPTTPGSSLATASTMTSAGSSPPDST